MLLKMKNIDLILFLDYLVIYMVILGFGIGWIISD